MVKFVLFFVCLIYTLHISIAQQVSSQASTDTASIGECAGPECVVSIAEQQQPQQHTRVTVVTSASDPYWTRLQNFVGSVQYWEPDLQIKVYDLGLSSENSNQVKMWRNVEYRKFPFNQFPPHFRNLQNFAWKPAVMNLSLWTDRGAILYQDAGQEFRQPIGEVEKLIFDNGYFFVVQEGLTTKSKCCGNIGELCHQGTFDFLEFDRKLYDDKVMCAGGIQGYVFNSSAHINVLNPTLQCAMQPNCIEPSGASKLNHRFDQAVFSLYIAKNDYYCQHDSKFWANHFNNNYPGGVPYNETMTNNVILFTRRGIGAQGRGGPYVKYLRNKE